MSLRVLANTAALIAQLPRMTKQMTGTAAQAASLFDQSATLDEQVTEMQRIKVKGNKHTENEQQHHASAAARLACDLPW